MLLCVPTFAYIDLIWCAFVSRFFIQLILFELVITNEINASDHLSVCAYYLFGLVSSDQNNNILQYTNVHIENKRGVSVYFYHRTLEMIHQTKLSVTLENYCQRNKNYCNLYLSHKHTHRTIFNFSRLKI